MRSIFDFSAENAKKRGSAGGAGWFRTPETLLDFNGRSSARVLAHYSAIQRASVWRDFVLTNRAHTPDDTSGRQYSRVRALRAAFERSNPSLSWASVTAGSGAAHGASSPIPCEALVQSLLWTDIFSACRFPGRPNTRPSGETTERCCMIENQ